MPKKEAPELKTAAEKKPTLAQLKTQAEQEFVEKYNALCDEYVLVIMPQLTLKVSPK